MTGAPLREAIEAASRVLGPLAARDTSIGAMTTYRVGGTAALFVVAAGDGDLVTVAEAAQASGLPVLVVGKGSNLLVADGGFAGIALALGEAYDWIERDAADGSVVRAGGAVALPVLARRTAAMGLTGLEWAVGVPGSVGGAVRMNAGGHGSDVAATLREATVADLHTGEVTVRAAGSLDLSYRRSSIGGGEVVVGAAFGLAPGDARAAEAAIAEIVRWRRENQPGGQNAGSVFANPPGDSAGRLIDAAGLKGHRVGTAEVSSKHANFFQADPGGRADDVFALIRHVQRRVEEHAGVRLRPEVRLVGFGEEAEAVLR